MAITLNNGLKMPIIGLGVWRMEGKDIRDLIINSIKIGYRHFDCAGTTLFHYLFFSSSLGIYIYIHIFLKKILCMINLAPVSSCTFRILPEFILFYLNLGCYFCLKFLIFLVLEP